MDAIDFIFEWSGTLISVMSKVCDWFVSPISLGLVGGGSFSTWLDGLFAKFTGNSNLPSVELVFGNSQITPIELIMGHLLPTVLGFILVKWVLDIVL